MKYMKAICKLVVILSLLNLNNNYCLDNLKSGVKRIFQPGYWFSISHGFWGTKTIILLQKYCKTSEQEVKNLLRCNILWNLVKLNIRFESIFSTKKAFIFSIKPFNFDYGAYFMPAGCVDGYPDVNCIIRRVGCCGVGLGMDFYYNKTTSKYRFSQNLSLFLNVIAKKIIPVDLILSYSPFIFSGGSGLYLELNLINFSFGNFIKALIMSFVDLESQYKPNWDITRGDDMKKIKLKRRYIEKVESIKTVNKEKVKFILLDNLLLSIVYNIRFYIGVRSKIMS